METQQNESEQQRLSALLNTGILDTPAEQAYDDITRLASFICKTPIAYISFITQDRQWYKSSIGIPFSETPREDALCLPTLHETALVHVPDMQLDTRFKDKKFVSSDLGLRFYAGFPLVNSEGYSLGTLCVIDYKVKKLSVDQRFALEALGRQVVNQLELRSLITLQEEAQEALIKSHEQTATILNSIGSSFFSLDASDNFIYLNSVAQKRLASKDNLLIGKNIWHEFPSLKETVLFAVVLTVRHSNERKNFEEFYPNTKTWFEVQVSPSTDGGTSVYAQDVTERKKGEERILHQALHDSLTGLPNRTLLTEQLLQACKQAQRDNQMCAVLFLDLDNFKDINDTLGHQAGDHLLKVVAERFQSTLRINDIIVRFGGDEFVIIAHRLKDMSDVTGVITALHTCLEKPIVLGTTSVIVNISIGVSMYPLDGADGDTLLKNADIALYEAKKQGRKTHRFYWDISMH